MGDPSPTTLSAFVALHGGLGPEVTLLEYLFRVFLHMVAFGGVAVLVLRWSDAVEAIGLGLSAKRAGEETER